MKIDPAEVRRIAALASLDLEEQDLARFAEQLSAILTYVESLARLDTRSVEPMFHSVEHPGPMREDVPRPGLGAEEATRGAPGNRRPGRPDAGAPAPAEAGRFIVPRVIG